MGVEGGLYLQEFFNFGFGKGKIFQYHLNNGTDEP
jgi:hypothetical protein